MIEERVLALDVSTKTGFALLISGDVYRLESHGRLTQIHEPITAVYPESYVDWAYSCYKEIEELIDQTAPDVLVIEETSKGSKNAMSQKILEFIHFLLARYIKETQIKAVYIMTESWRREIGCSMSKEEKERNKQVRKYKEKNKSKLAYDLNGKRIGLVGRKHVNIRRVNEIFKDFLKVPLRKKDEDEADALGLVICYHYRRVKNESKSLG